MTPWIESSSTWFRFAAFQLEHTTLYLYLKSIVILVVLKTTIKVDVKIQKRPFSALSSDSHMSNKQYAGLHTTMKYWRKLNNLRLKFGWIDKLGNHAIWYQKECRGIKEYNTLGREHNCLLCAMFVNKSTNNFCVMRRNTG